MFDDARWASDPREHSDRTPDPDRDDRSRLGSRDRGRTDARDVCMAGVDLPRGLDREHVRHRERDYTLRGSETRTLTTVGAFRVVPAGDLRDRFERPLDPRHGELWHLREAGLVRTVPLGRDTSVVTLTREGRELLESRRRDADAPDRQASHDGVQRPRELRHDAHIYRAYLEEAERLLDDGATIRRVVLDNDLKAEYQAFLQERNRHRKGSDGRPDRDVDEIRTWAFEHNLPCDERGHVHFPDARIQYEINGLERTLDVEVMTPHYRGAHGAAKAGGGFACYWSGGGARGAGRGGGGFGRSLAEEVLR